MIRTPLLRARGISKRYPGVRALDGVDLELSVGEVVGVVGENGAGKSTLMKVLAGIVMPDEGDLALDGKVVEIRSPRDARERGIALIHQELCLAENLSVGANVFLGREPGAFGWIDEDEVRERTRDVLARIGARFAPDTLVRSLAIGERQAVEIAKALAVDARVLILDEPTSSLTLAESERLFAVLRDLREKGVCIVYVSHRLGEVKALADRVVVLRDGRISGELARDEIEHDAMVRLMVGRDVVIERTAGSAKGGEPVLRVEDLVTRAHPHAAVSFDVGRGEVVGIAGLVGAGRTELLAALFGIESALAGLVSLAGERLAAAHPRDAVRAGVGLVPEDRKAQGLFLASSVRANVSIASLGRAFVDSTREVELAEEMVGTLSIRTAGIEQQVGLLSGGNQQKVVLAKWLAIRPRLLLLDEPTRGVDVGARQEIYALVRRLAGEGVAVLFASSEMEEVLTLADRVLVLCEGRLAGELTGDGLSEEAVMRLATGR